MKRSNLLECSDNFFATSAQECGVDVPLEQSSIWDTFDNAVPGRSPWRKLVWQVDGQDRAFISLTKMRGRGFSYLWAKHGPTWAGARPSPAEEAAFRTSLINFVKGTDKSIAFVRLHAYEAAADLHELLQSVTFDRTIVLDTSVSAEEILENMKSRGRRDVRKAKRDESLIAAEETDRFNEVFPELYSLLVETGERDEFGISPIGTYLNMLEALGPDNCKLFTVRREGKAMCWGIVTLTKTQATYYYAASSYEGRRAGAPDLLVYFMAQSVHDLGVTSFDLMGIDSPRAPQLAGVSGFKKKFNAEITEVPGAWDCAVYPWVYTGLTKALAAKRSGVRAVSELKNRVRKN